MTDSTSAHLPECEPWRGEPGDCCICDELRKCEERVRAEQCGDPRMVFNNLTVTGASITTSIDRSPQAKITKGSVLWHARLTAGGMTYGYIAALTERAIHRRVNRWSRRVLREWDRSAASYIYTGEQS